MADEPQDVIEPSNSEFDEDKPSSPEEEESQENRNIVCGLDRIRPNKKYTDIPAPERLTIRKRDYLTKPGEPSTDALAKNQDLFSDAKHQKNVKQLEFQQIRKIKNDISKTEGEQFQIDLARKNAKELHEARIEQKRAETIRKYEYAFFRSEQQRKMLAEIRAEKLEKSSTSQQESLARRLKILQLQQNYRIHLIKSRIKKDRQTCAYMKAKNEKRIKDRQELAAFNKMFRAEAKKAELERNSNTNKLLTETLKSRARRHQDRVLENRASLPDRLAARQAEHDRVWAIVRKYFYRWIENVKKRKARRPDSFHQSFWETTGEVETTVKYLRKESGYEKFDDFIMNIVKLKRDIMAELESEEQAERAAALGIARAEDEDGESDGNTDSSEQDGKTGTEENSDLPE